MTAKWIMWIPRPKNIADMKDGGKPSLTTKAMGWKTYVEQKTITKDEKEVKKYEHYLKYVDDPFPGEPGEDDVVYIFSGHGVAGRQNVTWPGDQNPLDAPFIATKFSQRGWGAQFNGRIKIYSCYSGDGVPPFAKTVAAAIRGKGYTNCAYFGYHGEITQQYETSATTGVKGVKFQDIQQEDHGTHRWSIQPGAKYLRLKKKRDPF